MNGDEGSIEDEAAISSAKAVFESTNRKLINSGRNYKYVLGPMKDSLRMG